MNFQAQYDQRKQWVEDNLIFLLPKPDPKSQTLYDAMIYSVKAGGKRIRPILLLASNELCGGNTKEAMPFACAIEYIHTYSLIHDDLPAMDDDDYRRGKPSNHKVFGEAAAILAGDGLLNAAMELVLDDICKDTSRSINFDCKILAAREIFKAAGVKGMIGGQVADIKAEGTLASKEDLDYIHLNKTTALMTASVRAGAILGQGSEKMLESLTLFSKNLGLAFQITDDILDLCGDEMLLGKSLRSDLRHKKTTYPALYGVDASKKRVRQLHDMAYDALEQYEGTEFLKALLKALRDRGF